MKSGLELLGLDKTEKKSLWNDDIQRIGTKFALVLSLAYVTSSATLSLVVSPALLEIAVKARGQNVAQNGKFVWPRNSLNSHAFKKAVVARNLFNKDGEFPDEEEKVEEKVEKKSINFDIDGPCPASRLKLTLLGTIYLGGDDGSIAIVQQSGVSFSDTYKNHDDILDHDDVQIVHILRNRIVLNNKGTKECLEIKLGGRGEDVTFEKKAPSPEEGEQTNFSVVVPLKFVEAELGDGSGKAINSARTIPIMVDGIPGYKVFAIKKGSLLDRIGLKNRDVIMKINGTEMVAESGLLIFNVFSQVREIKFQILRKGKVPTTIDVTVK